MRLSDSSFTVPLYFVTENEFQAVGYNATLKLSFIRVFLTSKPLEETLTPFNKAQCDLNGSFRANRHFGKLGSCHKRRKPQAPTPQAPIHNRQTRKVANAKVLNRNTNLT